MKKIISILLCISMLLGMAAFVTAAGATEVTASKKVADLITEYGWTNTTTKQSFKLDDVVSVKINGGNNTGKAYDGDHIRIYATDTPAGTMTISVADGYELISVKISTQTGTYAYLCVDGTSNDISNKTIEVTGSSVVLKSLKNGSNGKQVRVTGFEVVYSSAGGSGPHEHNTNTTYYDENGHWNSCNCNDPDAPKTELVPHELSKKFDANGHWDVCAGCDYTTASVEHTFENGVCACGAHDPNAYLENPIVGKPLKLGVYNPNNKAFYFANGKIANSYYLGTTTNITESADLIITDTDGGYHLSLKSGEETFYINIAAVWNANKNKYSYNMKLEDTATTVFTWNDTYHTFQTLFDEDAYYIGTYNTYNTISASNLDYITTSFPAHIYCTHTWADATCTAPKTCTICGATEGEALGHSYSDATCTTPKTCSVCGHTDGESLGHSYVDATCTTPKTCSVCGHTDGESLGHSYVDATCTTPKTCSVCGATDGAALGHTPGAAATCTTAQTCTVCGKTLNPALGHKFENGTCANEGCDVADPNCEHAHTKVDGAVAATCTTPGKTGNTLCTDCGALVTESTDTDPLGHTPGAAATCTTAQTCTVCDAVLDAAKGHTPGAAATCTTAQTCTVCDAVLAAAKGHTPGAAATCTTAQTCTVCDAVLAAAKGHTPGAAATCTTAQTCTVCDAVLTAATGHTFADGKCTVCEAADPDYVAPTEPKDEGNSTSSDVIGDNGWENSKLVESFTIGSNITVSVTATPKGEWGQNSGKYYDSDKTWRIYQNETPTVTIAAGTGKIVSVKVTYISQNGGVLTLNGQTVESDAVVEVNAASISFAVANSGDKENGQARITAIEVIHTGPASSTPDATEPEATEPEATEPEATKPVTEGGEFDVVTKPTASEPFKFGMTQANLENAVYYLKGGMDGYYMATTTDINEAIDVYLEETEGGYHLYTMVDGTKTYINMVVSGTHVNGAYEATASTVYTLKNGTLVATVEVEGEAAEYWFGTRNDKQYTTMGPCKTSYEGFYGQFYGTSNPETADTFSSIVFALMALSAIGAGVVISKKKEF